VQLFAVLVPRPRIMSPTLEVVREEVQSRLVRVVPRSCALRGAAATNPANVAPMMISLISHPL
jgi:hypothetical protein